MSQNFRKIPVTCRYWQQGKCLKGDFQCTYVHGYVCPNDRRCRRENCTRFHVNQTRRPQQRDYRGKQCQDHHRQGQRGRYRRSRSRSISPLRRQQTFRHSRTPPRHRSRSRSPPYRPIKDYSPIHHRSRSISPSQYHRSTSWRQSRSCSPARFRSRSCSPDKPQSRSHILDPSHSRSHSLVRMRSRSHSFGRVRSRSRSLGRARSRSRNLGRVRSRSRSLGRVRSRSRSLGRVRSRSRSLGRFRSRSRSLGRVRSRSRSLGRVRSRSRSLGRVRSRSCSLGRVRSRSCSLGRVRSRSRSLGRVRSRSRSLGRIRSRSRSLGRRRSRSHSLGRLQGRSCSPDQYRSKSHTPAHLERNHSSSQLRSRSRSNSQSRPQAGSIQGQLRSRSPSMTRLSSRSHSVIRDRSRSYSRSRLRSRSNSPSKYETGSCSSAHSLSKSETPTLHHSKNHSSSQDQSRSHSMVNENQLDFEDIYADLDGETEVFPSAAAGQCSVEKMAISELQARITRNFMNPHTQMLMKEILKTTSDKSKDGSPKQKKSQGLLSSDEHVEVDKLGLDLEEVGEEVDDIFTKSVTRTVDDSIDSAFKEGLQSGKRQREIQAGSNPSPPKPKPLPKATQVSRDIDIGYRSDWELKTSLEDPSKPIEKHVQASMAPPKVAASGIKSNSSPLWTPALDRRHVQESKLKMACQSRASDWEVETPYVGRKDKAEVQQEDKISGRETKTGSRPVIPSIAAHPRPEPVLTYESVHLTNERIPEQSMEKTSQSKTMLFPSGQSISVSIPPTMSHGVISSISTSSATVGGYGTAALNTSLAQSADLLREFIKVRPSYPSPEGGGRSSKKAPVEHKVRKSSESPKRSKHKRHREKKTKRKKSSSDSESDSDVSNHEKRKLDKKVSPEPEKEQKNNELLLSKKESLTKRVKMLMEQKKKMIEQRGDIIKNHKGSRESLSNLLEENRFLMTEIAKQIMKINDMVFLIDQDIEAGGGDVNQITSQSRERSESPYHSKERQRKPGYSPEREKHRKAFYRSPERKELDMSPSIKTKRARSPQRKENWSPPSLRHKSNEPLRSIEHSHKHTRSPQWSEQKSSLSKSSKCNKSRSPVPVLPKESTRHISTPESQKSQSPPKKPRANSNETSKKQTCPRGKSHLEPAKVETDETMQYAPLATQRTFFRYMDQGMHWCKLCSIFCETVPEYVSHLMTPSHLSRLKNDRKSWLAKAPKEEKEPKPSNAQTLTVPLLGMEFLHSLPAYYCSLCDTFMRDKGEAVRHPESKSHVSNYKVHRAKNPMYESTFLKAKTAAYAKYSVEEERKLLEGQLNLKEKSMSHELEEKLIKQIKEKKDKNKYDKDSRDEKAVLESKEEKNKACGSIRVASRGPRHSSDKKSDNRQKHKESLKRQSEDKQVSLQDDSTPKIKSKEECLKRDEQQKSEKIQTNYDTERKDVDITENEGVSKNAEEPSKDREEEKKSAVPKLPLIGKMPFFKKRPTVPKSKEQQKTTHVQQQLPVQQHDLFTDAKASTDTQILLPIQEGKTATEAKKVCELPLSPVSHKKGFNNEETDNIINITQEKAHPVQDSENITENVLNEIKDLSTAEDPTIYFEERSNEPITMDFEDCSDSEDFKLYDSLENGNEESSECAAAATLHALDLLSIPLPGLKRVVDTTPASDVLLPPGTENEQQCQESSNLATDDGPSSIYEPESEPIVVLAENSGPEVPTCKMSVQDHSSGAWSTVSNSKESLLKSTSGNLKKLEIPLPPGTEEISQTHENLTLPPPPGTENEGPNYNQGCDIDIVVAPTTVASVFEPGFQELSSGAWSMGSNSQEDFGMPLLPTRSGKTAEIPLPPGTEDEYCVHEISCLPSSSGVAEDISVPSSSDQKGLIAQKYIQKLSSGTCSSGSDSFDDFPAPSSQTDRPVPNASVPIGIGHRQWPAIKPTRCPTMPDATNFTNWSSLSHTKRERTPPPPGTENMIVNELEDTPGELGEASMELSEDSESEDDCDTRETTPPPPGTESALVFKSVTPKRSIIKSSPLTSRLEHKENKLNPKRNTHSKAFPVLPAADKQTLCPVSEKQKSLKSLSQRKEKEEESDIKLQIYSTDVKISPSDSDLHDFPKTSGVESTTQNTKILECHKTDGKGDVKDFKVPECKKTILSSSCDSVESDKLISEDTTEILESSEVYVAHGAQDTAFRSLDCKSKKTGKEICALKTEIKNLVHKEFSHNVNKVYIGQDTNIILPPTHESTNTGESSCGNGSDSSNIIGDKKNSQAQSPDAQGSVKTCSKTDEYSEIDENNRSSEKNQAQLDTEEKQSPFEMDETGHYASVYLGEEKLNTQRVESDQPTDYITSRTTKYTVVDQKDPEVEETRQLEQLSVAIIEEETEVKQSPSRRTSRTVKTSAGEQELKVKHHIGPQSSRGKKAVIAVKEEPRKNVSSTPTTKNEGVLAEEAENQEQEKEFSSKNTSRAKKDSVPKEQLLKLKQATPRRTPRGKKTVKIQEDGVKSDPQISHRATRANRSIILEKEQEKHHTENAPKLSKKVTDEDDMKSTEEVAGTSQSNTVAKASTVEVLVDEEEKLSVLRKSTRPKRTIGNEETEKNTHKIEEPVHKKIKSAPSKNRVSHRATKIVNSSRPVRSSSRKSAIASSAARIAQVTDQEGMSSASLLLEEESEEESE